MFIRLWLFPFWLQNASRLDSEIRYERDFEYDYFGFKTLERSYLLKVQGQIVERPQHLLMRVALGIHKDDIESAVRTYHLMSQRWFTHASPTLFNAGTPTPQVWLLLIMLLLSINSFFSYYLRSSILDLICCIICTTNEILYWGPEIVLFREPFWGFYCAFLWCPLWRPKFSNVFFLLLLNIRFYIKWVMLWSFMGIKWCQFELLYNFWYKKYSKILCSFDLYFKNLKKFSTAPFYAHEISKCHLFYVESNGQRKQEKHLES